MSKISERPCGLEGIYQPCGEQHLHRYLAEYDFRYDNRSRLRVACGKLP